MNILVDIRPLMDERYSGVAEYTLELVTALVAADRQNRYILWYNSGRDISGRMPVFDYPNVTMIRTKLPNKLFNYAFVKLWRRPLIDRLIKQPIDIFLMPHLNFAAVSSWVKSIVTVHDLSFLIFPEFFSWRKNVWHRLLSVKKMLRRFNRIVALSDNTAADISRIAAIEEKNISVIHAGLSDTFRPLLRDDKGMDNAKQKYNLRNRFIFFLGTVEPRKNIGGLIEAFEILKQGSGYDDLELVIAGGRGWKAGPIYRQAKASRCNAQIRFLDYIDKEDKIYLYNAALLFAYPSFYEGFGFPPLEAMACGTPTIVSASASLPEVVGKAALMIDPYNPSALAAGMKEILEDNELSASLSDAGREQAGKFTWDKAARGYMELFAELYGNR